MSLSPARVGVVIVNFNGGDVVIDCLESVLASTLPVQVALADNGSSDGSLARVRRRFAAEPRLTVVDNGANLGFAAGANRALRRLPARLPWVLFLNPDCRIGEDTLARMLVELEGRPEVGMAGCLIVGADGLEQRGCRRREPTPGRALATMLPFWRGGEQVNQLLEALPTRPVTVDAISGAFMLVRREALADVGLMDERYFLHCEDLDWCKRFRERGWRILFVPNVRITHLKGASSASRPVRVEWHKHRGMIRYYRKFFSGKHPFYLLWGVQAAVWLRFLTLLPMLWLSRMARGKRGLSPDP